MTPPGKANHRTHTQPQLSFCFCLLGEGTTTSAVHPQVIGRIWKHSIPRRQNPFASPIACRQLVRVPTGIPQHHVCGPASRSTVLRCVGGVLCPLPNRARCHRHGLGEHCEQLFGESSSEKIFPSSGASAPSFGPTKRSTSSWRSASAARSGRRSFTSAVAASLRTKRSWSCSTNYGPVSGPWVEGEPRECDGSAWDRLPPLIKSSDGRTDEALARETGSVVEGSAPRHRRCPHHEGVGQAGVGSERSSPSEAIFECRSESNQRQVRSAGWPKAPVRSRSIPVGWVASRRDCRAAVCARGDEPRATITQRGVWYSPQRTQRKGRKHLGADDRSLAALSARLAFSAGRAA